MDQLKISVGRSRRDTQWRNLTLTWDELLNRLRETKRTSETVAEFHALPKTKRDDIKDVGGFVGGHLRDGRRKSTNVESRSLLCLDLDSPRSDLWDALTLLYDWRCCLYSTHSHTPESPRLRLIVPLSREVTSDEYPALGRKLAEDIGIDQFDDTTYEASRLMYWPSTPVDGDYLFETQDGPLLDVDELLGRYADWRDVSSWPTSSREMKAPVVRGLKQAEPTTKTGVVGAFCRAYNVVEALEAFLPGVYSPTAQADRWTFVGGESSNGLVIYDNATFAYSHHSTDPISGQLVNAWDLVRIHRFGGLDAGVRDDAAGVARPSYRAMCDLARDDEKIKSILGAEKLIEAADEFAPIPDGVELDTSWMTQLERDRRGSVVDSLPNLALIMEHDQRLSGIVWNTLLDGLDIADDQLLPWRRLRQTGWGDGDWAALRTYLSATYGVYHVGRTQDAVTSVAIQTRRVNPITDWLDSLPDWDGVERLDTLLIDYLGAEDSPYVRAVTRKTIVALVARAYRPGIKFDHALVLLGHQGIGKSIFCAILGGPWYSDSLSLTDMRDKTGAEKLQGCWLMELSEMSGMRKTEVEVVKSFISRTEDHYRAAYGRSVEHRPRSCVFIGTTNSSDGFLRDITGNRRFWPVDCAGGTDKKPWDIDEVTREQIFAEARIRWQAKERLHLPPELEAVALRAQTRAIEADDRLGIVEAYLDTLLPENWDQLNTFERRRFLEIDSDFTGSNSTGVIQREYVSNIEIWCEALGRNASELTAKDSYGIGAIMAKLDGWERTDERRWLPIYGRQRLYARTSVLDKTAIVDGEVVLVPTALSGQGQVAEGLSR